LQVMRDCRRRKSNPQLESKVKSGYRFSKLKTMRLPKLSTSYQTCLPTEQSTCRNKNNFLPKFKMTMQKLKNNLWLFNDKTFLLEKKLKKSNLKTTFKSTPHLKDLKLLWTRSTIVTWARSTLTWSETWQV